jgi:plasmid stabilization system protein ParE
VKPSVRLWPAAADELAAAVAWYDEQKRGLGKALFDTVAHQLEVLRTHSLAGTAAGAEFRRMLVPRFPYHIVYRLRGGDIEVVAFAHVKRRPDYWKRRTSGGSG